MFMGAAVATLNLGDSAFWVGVSAIGVLPIVGYIFLRWPLLFGLSLFMVSTSLNAVWWNAGIRIRPEHVVALVLLGVLVAELMVSKRRTVYVNLRSLQFYGFFMLSVSLSTLMAVDTWFAVKGIVSFILQYGFLLIICAIVANQRQLRIATTIWIILGILSAALAFVQLWGYLTCNEDLLLNLALNVAKTDYPYGMDRTYRARAFWGDPNNYGGFLLCSIPLLLSKTIDAWQSKRRYRWGLVVASLIGVSGLILSWSRSSLLGLAVAMLVLIFEWRKFLKAKKFLYLLLLVVVLTLMVGMVIWNIPYLREAATDRFTLERESGMGGRFDLYGIAFDVFMRSPILGSGPNSFGFIYARDYGGETGWGVHSFFLQLLTDVGLLGFSAYVLWYGLLMRYAYICTRRQNQESRVVGAGLLAAQVGLLMPNLLYGNLGYSCVYVLHALVLISYRLLRDDPEDLSPDKRIPGTVPA